MCAADNSFLSSIFYYLRLIIRYDTWKIVLAQYYSRIAELKVVQVRQMKDR
jgi:hypothetical protein